MELTKKDRLILYNQYEILKLLNSEDESLIKQYEINQEILLNGYKFNYNDLIECVIDDIPIEVSEFVWDILQLYRILYVSYNALSAEEKEQVNVKDIKYAGFDGNEEPDYYLYANFILEKMGRYEEIYDNGNYTANSHRNMVPRYTGMIETWERISVGRYKNLSLTQIIDILSNEMQ